MVEQSLVYIYLFLCSILFISHTRSAPVINETSSVPLLLLISFDGFRWDYPDIYKLPHFDSLQKRGVRVKHIDNSFATVTFPSHYTMVTGLFEETHGIVANSMYDPVLKAVADISTMNDTKWWSQNAYSQPIWVSNQLASDVLQRRSGVIDWPGSSVPINGYRPYEYLDFDITRSLDSAFRQILKWFREPAASRINFGAVYHAEPDVTGHLHGPISPEMNETLKKCDDYLGGLLQMIDDDDYLRQNLNVIITSDHGMHDVEKTHRIFLVDYIDKSLFTAYGGRAFANIFANKASDIDRLYANLSNLTDYEVYKKSQIPVEYHYKSNVRVGDILIVGKVGHDVIIPGDETYAHIVGDHGYDNRAESMHPILYAFGPAFYQNLLAEPFRNVDLYPLMSHVLHLKQRPTNGSLSNVKHILVDFRPEMSSTILVIICLTLVALSAILFTVCAWRHSRQLVYVPPDKVIVEYHRLNNQEGAFDYSSEGEDDIDNEKL
ncbi:unnamed protein product [Adineta ricciae]|uniref:Uncharacterized protein n=1 Tax=Adineta ricciae TaxID=249248 RepID=A0A814WR66_ADIRI|nr:unnamed protein product [Adineta ricciae]CAF1207469.1 unnamed protein product [Adineta ricciae]